MIDGSKYFCFNTLITRIKSGRDSCYGLAPVTSKLAEAQIGPYSF